MSSSAVAFNAAERVPCCRARAWEARPGWNQGKVHDDLMVNVVPSMVCALGLLRGSLKTTEDQLIVPAVALLNSPPCALMLAFEAAITER